MILNWKATDEEFSLAARIAERALDELANDLERLGVNSPRRRGGLRRDYLMDVLATHLNGRPLDLARLLEAKRTDFLHDVVGIRTHIDRETGQLKNCFVPRYAAAEVRA